MNFILERTNQFLNILKASVERPTSWDAAKFEVCAHKWADYAEPDYGVALINDCKYGYDIHDGVMKISLIKCRTYPNADADIGHHKFRYSLVPHKGDWRDAKIAKEVHSFNCLLIGVQFEGEGKLPSEYALVMPDKPNVIITALKEACESEDIILRMYEAHGIRRRTQISCSFGMDRVYEADMMENELET